MDIRGAKQGGAGAVPHSGLTPEKPAQPVPALDDRGLPSAPDTGDDMDIVIQQYREFLEKNGVTEEDLQAIFSAIITTGTVAWNFLLFDSIPVEFQMRKSWVNDYLLELMDAETEGAAKVSMVRFNNMVSVCNLAASMTKFRDETYTVDTREDIDAARKRVQDMPYIIQSALVNKLAVFDRTVAVATSDWAVKNFTKPRKGR